MYAPLLSQLPILLAVAACFVCALGLTAALVAITIRVCRKNGWVCKPRSDRWHKGAPAFFGGVPLWVGFTLASTVFVPWSNLLIWRLLGLATLMFL
jgi:UDP-N-acetylmuramyl pentapeptide phosphotransferase/UDP-N-acetylglucosamine-1-phosphate transferase